MTQWPIDWRATVDEAVRRRKQEGLTQAQLATLAGVSRPTVVAFEQGEINLRFERLIAILDALGLFVQPGRSDSLQSFVHDARNRFKELVARLDDDHPSRQPLGHSEQAYAIEGVENPPSLTRLKDILARAPKTSGWTPFWVPTKESIKPGFHDGLLECWLGRPEADRVFNDPASSDFWQITRDGSAYLRRGFQEDGRDLDAGSFFDLTLPIWRTAEVLRHAAWLARQLGAGEGAIRFVGRYAGLAGRELISWAKPALRLALDERHRARSDSVDLVALTDAAAIEQDLAAVVGAIVRPLYERFDGFDPPGALIAGQIAEFERNLATFR
ncbi:helix-turn-helix domain-containing protein [Novosphingobium sp. Gsoil 351]|uniref:helix-turn-helix domain-containing protein n=1 Tax=Novosphingobium sp. Gsoil 351 TaxID=2675225 RepID=UPI001E54280F|nr:helix-turn-helix domain-containing protein [Novosphingobium sp. Gsoil 351]